MHTVWFDLVWYGMVWYGMVWYGMVWYTRQAVLLYVFGAIALAVLSMSLKDCPWGRESHR